MHIEGFDLDVMAARVWRTPQADREDVGFGDDGLGLQVRAAINQPNLWPRPSGRSETKVTSAGRGGLPSAART